MEPPPYHTVAGTPNPKGLEGRLKIVVGLDYGTTNSGISYVTSDQDSADKIEVIRQWPNGPGIIGKVPSVIAYKKDNPEDLEDEGDQWGFSATGLKSYVWTKLLLGKDIRTGEVNTADMKAIYGDGFCSLPTGTTAKTVVSDYLRGLYNHLLERLQRHDEGTYRVTPIEFWVTVPAMWSDAAKALTIEAAQAAGFGSRSIDTIHIITEPEAAALSVLMPRVGFGSVTGLENGPQNILICDCGGGTVDIVTYKVMLKDGKVNFEELLVGAGAMCGSTAIDRNFNKWMTDKFGDAYTKIDPELRGPSSNFFRQFEVAKKNFTGPNHTKRIDVWPLNMNAPKSAKYDKRNFTVRLQTSDMLELFDPPIDQILKLVESQVDAAKSKGSHIDQIFLVGGFGDSPYLNLRLKAWCTPKHIKLSCPPSCQEAIVKGAALRGLEDLKPNKRIARRHYGYSISLPFREGIDNEDYAWVCEWDKSKWCNHRMEWFLNKGEGLEEFQTKSISLFRTVWENSADLTSVIHVWNSEQDNPPESCKHWSMTKMGTVRFSFNEKDVKTGESKGIGGRTMYKLYYNMEVDLFSERGDIQFRFLYNGQHKGDGKIQFEQTYDMMLP